MKAAVIALLATSASAFTVPTMTFAVGKKSPAKKAAKTVAVKAKAAPKVVAKKAAPAKKAVTKKVAPVKKAVAKKAAPVKKVVAKKAAPVKKVVAKKAAPVKKVVAKKAAPPVKKVFAASTATVPSIAIPNEEAPGILDGSLPGDVGFDPCFLSTKADLMAPYFNGIFADSANIDGLTWYREAELMHGRICMMAVVGFIVPGFGTFAGNEWTGVDAYSYTNPLEALGNAPSAALFQIFAFMSILEFRRIGIITGDGAGYMAGDSQKWGQGDGRWNPLGLDYSPEAYAEKQLQEVKHARLAMIGLLGLIFQANASGVNVVQQWSAAFTVPDYAAKAGYFLPEGI